ncbi:DUF2291 family protein [Patulibacter americanus]|uniref:DUF2291 family protein n=1 Tax=Patulibacter americanus TaxID=588672 RepID=UPI0003B5B322|nr:DUF2291 domain-containing protein [Patulibacter americanus]
MSTGIDAGDRETTQRRRLPLRAVLWGLAALIAVAMVLDTTYKDPDEKLDAGGRAAFDPKAYGEQNYDAKVVPALRKKVVPLTELLPALEKDPDAAGERYGHREGQSPYNFVVTAEGTAGKAESGLMPVEVDGAGDATVSVQIGPAINGTALRDASGIITFNQFVNQVDYADAATALNTQVKTKTLAGFDAAAAEGKTVSFTGAFTFLAPTSVTVTPIELEVTG